jgi:hypothetical protein
MDIRGLNTKCQFYLNWHHKSVFIVVQYLVTNVGLPGKNQFHFQGNIVKAYCISESMWNVFALIFRVWDYDVFRCDM